MLNINKFISDNITFRKGSMFLQDINDHRETLSGAIKSKRMLVIGGAGSIGSSFIKACLPFKPAELVIVDWSENGLAELTRDLRSTYGMYVPDIYRAYPISYADPIFERLFREAHGFDIVANFSAHKHVRSEKDVYSVQALIENNVLKANRLMGLLAEFPPDRFFCVSTDKAANPVNVMGCSKKVMEELAMSYSPHFIVNTARFANVAFSNGSLLAGFIERMMKRQPLSAPDDVRRYFVSPEESGQICMLACMLGRGREVFFPKLDERQMMTFSAIADAFVRMQGYEPHRCGSEEEAKRRAAGMKMGTTEYPVYYFHSDTTGEKGFEEFYVEGETVDLGRFKSLGIITDYPAKPVNEVETYMHSLSELMADGATKEDIVKSLKSFVPNFEHEEKGRNLDQKM